MIVGIGTPMQISILKTTFTGKELHNQLSQIGMQPFVFSEETISTSTKYPQTKALLTGMVTSISIGFHCTQAADTWTEDDFYGSDGCYTFEITIENEHGRILYQQIHKLDSIGKITVQTGIQVTTKQQKHADCS